MVACSLTGLHEKYLIVWQDRFILLIKYLRFKYKRNSLEGEALRNKCSKMYQIFFSKEFNRHHS